MQSDCQVSDYLLSDPVVYFKVLPALKSLKGISHVNLKLTHNHRHSLPDHTVEHHTHTNSLPGHTVEHHTHTHTHIPIHPNLTNAVACTHTLTNKHSVSLKYSAAFACTHTSF